MEKNSEQQERCPLCGNVMEDAEECQYCDYKRRNHASVMVDDI